MGLVIRWGACTADDRGKEVLRTNGDLNAGFTQNVQSRLCDEASAEHKHLAVRGRQQVSRLSRLMLILMPKPAHNTIRPPQSRARARASRGANRQEKLTACASLRYEITRTVGTPSLLE